MTVTKEQAMAFVEALTGFTAVAENGSDDCGESKSPHAMTHLTAALGFGNVANFITVSRALTKPLYPNTDPYAKDRAKAEELCAYLEGVVVALRTAMKREPQTDSKSV